MSKKIRILSIDGGGIRGILPGVVMTYLESQLQKKVNSEVRLSDYFDLLAGTSTGGILTCAYLVPNENDRPKFTAEQAVNLYMERGEDIFHISLKQAIKSKRGYTDEKYSAEALEEALNDYFGDTKLNELLKPCLITAYDIRKRRTFFFNKTDATSDIENFYVKDIARATSAAPTYFEAARIKSLYGTPYPLVDGGVFANNPTMCAYSEARTLDFPVLLEDNEKPSKPSAKDMLIVSIGTGSKPEPYYYDDAKDWGMIEWIKPVIDIMMSGNSETVDYQLKLIFDTLQEDHKKDYIRLEPDVGNASTDMDDASEENLEALYEAGKSFVSDNKDRLDAIVDKLIEHH